jgi:hypothetical protein
MRKIFLKASNSNGLEPGLLDSLPNDPHFGYIFGPPPSLYVGGGSESRVNTRLCSFLNFFYFKKTD